MAGRLFLSEVHRMPPGYGGLGSRVRRCLYKWIERSLRDHAPRKSGFFEVPAGSHALVSDVLRPYFPEDAVTYSARTLERLDAIAFADLHRYADALDEAARRVGGTAGVCHCGLTSFRITETRWLVQIMLYYVLYLDILIEEIARSEPQVLVHANPKSLMGRLASALAKQAGLSEEMRRHPLSLWPLRVLEHLELRHSDRKANAPILEYWARTSTGEGILGPKEKVDVLFVAYKPRTIQRLPSVVKAARARGLSCAVLSLGKGGAVVKLPELRELADSGVAIHWFEDFVAPEFSKERVPGIVRAARDQVARILETTPFTYRGVRIDGITNPYILDTLPTLSGVSALFVEGAQNFLARVTPRATIHFEDYEPNRSITLLSKAPSFSYYCLSPVAYAGLIRRLPDYLCSSGQILARAFTSPNQWSAEEIGIVGDPNMDKFGHLDRAEAARNLRRRLGLPEGTKIAMVVATYASEIMPREKVEEFSELAVRAARQAGWYPIVKAHPQPSLESTKAFFRNMDVPDNAFFQHEDLVQLAAGCDAAFLMFSTATTLVLLGGTPVISLLPAASAESIRAKFEYGEENGILPRLLENTPAELAADLHDDVLLGRLGRNGRDYVQRHSGPLDGRNAERFVDFVGARLGHE